ncbi:MAG TPA: STAS domain-containing protein [Thermomicrobiales bacterium]
MQVTVDTLANATAVVHLAGQLDALSAPDVRAALASAVAGGHARLVVDLAQVGFVDSSGLSSLISGLKAARIAGGDLRIAQPSTQVSAVLTLTLLDRVLRSYPTVADALNGY